MISCEAQRTLVKSPPELWAELSDPESLARHLGEFGEIRIVRTEPESAVEWEGEGVAGSVQLKTSGWGTRVTLTATRQPPRPEPEPVAEPEPVLEAQPEPVVEPEPVLEAQPEPEPTPVRRSGFWPRLFRRRHAEPAPDPEPQPVLEAEPEPEPQPVLEAQPEPQSEPEGQEQEQPDIAAELLALEESSAARTTAVLTTVLDRLGAAHHRPFSRS